MDELEYYDGQYSGPQIDDILSNSTKQNAIAIVSNNNNHIAITSGQYVYVKNHGTLAEGLYKATTNIQANGTLTTNNVTAVSRGVANDLKSALNSAAFLGNVQSRAVVKTVSDGSNDYYTIPVAGWYRIDVNTTNATSSGTIYIGNNIVLLSCDVGQKFDAVYPFSEGTILRFYAPNPGVINLVQYT